MKQLLTTLKTVKAAQTNKKLSSSHVQVLRCVTSRCEHYPDSDKKGGQQKPTAEETFLY